MALCFNDFLCNSGLATNSTLLAFSQAGLGAGCVLVRNDFFGVALSRNFVRSIGIATCTGVGGITNLSTGRGSSFGLVGMCVNLIGSFLYDNQHIAFIQNNLGGFSIAEAACIRNFRCIRTVLCIEGFNYSALINICIAAIVQICDLGSFIYLQGATVPNNICLAIDNSVAVVISAIIEVIDACILFSAINGNILANNNSTVVADCQACCIFYSALTNQIQLSTLANIEHTVLVCYITVDFEVIQINAYSTANGNALGESHIIQQGNQNGIAMCNSLCQGCKLDSVVCLANGAGQLSDFLLLAGHFFLTYGAVYNFVVRTGSIQSCIDLVLNNCFSLGMTQSIDYFFVGIATCAGEGLNALLFAGGCLGYLGCMAVTGCIHIVCNVAMAAVASIGGVALLGAGGFGNLGLVFMAVGRNLFLCYQYLTTGLTMLAFGQTGFCTGGCLCLIDHFGVAGGCDLLGVGIAACAGEGLFALLFAGGFLSYLGCMAVAGCIHIVCYIGITAVTGIGGVTLLGTGGCGCDFIVVMIGCGNILTALNHFTTLGTNLITSIAIFRAACRLLALSLSIEMFTNSLTTDFLVTYRTVNNQLIRLCGLVLNHCIRSYMILACNHYLATSTCNRCCAVVIFRLGNTFMYNLKVTVIGRATKHRTRLQAKRFQPHKRSTLCANVLRAIGTNHRGNDT